MQSASMANSGTRIPTTAPPACRRFRRFRFRSRGRSRRRDGRFARPVLDQWPLPRPRRGRSTDRVNDVALREMTDDSGGRTEIVRGARDLEPATGSIADELSKQDLPGISGCQAQETDGGTRFGSNFATADIRCARGADMSQARIPRATSRDGPGPQPSWKRRRPSRRVVAAALQR